MLIFKNLEKSKNTVFFDVDGFERAIRFAIQTKVSAEKFNNILNDYIINYSNAMKHYAQEMMYKLRDQGEKFEVIDLSKQKGEEYKVKFLIFDNEYGTVRATTRQAEGGRYYVGLCFEGLSKTNDIKQEL